MVKEKRLNQLFTQREFLSECLQSTKPEVVLNYSYYDYILMINKGSRGRRDGKYHDRV